MIHQLRNSVLLLALLFAVSMAPVHAADVDTLKNQIEDRAKKIQELEKEIAQYENELVGISAAKRTLQGTINELDISRKKLATDIQLTENRISATSQQINELSSEIADKQRRIDLNSEAVAEALRNLDEMESQSLVAAILSNHDLNAFWSDLDTLQQLQVVLRDEVKSLSQLKEQLEDVKVTNERKQRELSGFREELSGQKSVLDVTRTQQNQLLAQTKNTESTYQSILEEKRAAHEQFENELADLEAQLQIAIDPSAIPAVGEGVLNWPFEDSYMLRCPSYEKALGNIFCLTQYFGNTPFATANAQIYSGRGHNGVDFRAPIGTKITSALSGTVVGTGNTDLQKGCYSYGKWALIRHNNGLSTLYAHLSHIAVVEGQVIKTGDLVGYSGNTGYSTGPHLHFGVYASQGVQVVQFTKSINCKNVYVPIAPQDAYLNPLSFL
ncbi:hypothetical protein COU17_00135 [Candidatus Kaiserbacteria bacterium CG10_big_fil_rev_8_21_14_0_10_49_17]|uniref:M23ase beta-sheet core domain-containing protein n=1 Tax=Candidatus Kaiserbacteria bacterium CG10_big_fil_rev_8_21_14_0_10_49_17 TaxID=1974609 RepID=A0A2M6WF57_9BACT|nr:MAG: hypothetical protein COU17_00135 [Candidatus Kaiserbacteria bacterium CG10_big_fil_rev_8_21_14_0_10_49_17]